MARYFDKNEDINMDSLTFGYVLFIKYKLDELGYFKGNLVLLKKLWEIFSEDQYCANFLIPDDESVEEFADWLDDYDEDV